jgi:hypothetical protein
MELWSSALSAFNGSGNTADAVYTDANGDQIQNPHPQITTDPLAEVGGSGSRGDHQQHAPEDGSASYLGSTLSYIGSLTSPTTHTIRLSADPIGSGAVCF